MLIHCNYNLSLLDTLFIILILFCFHASYSMNDTISKTFDPACIIRTAVFELTRSRAAPRLWCSDVAVARRTLEPTISRACHRSAGTRQRISASAVTSAALATLRHTHPFIKRRAGARRDCWVSSRHRRRGRGHEKTRGEEWKRGGVG